MAKRFVLDTNVLLHSIDTINDIVKEGGIPVIPLMAIEELDKQKAQTLDREKQYKARVMLRYIRKNKNDLEFTSKLRDDWEWILKENDLDKDYQDNKMLMLDLLTEDDVVLVTQDQAMNMKGDALKIEVRYIEDVKLKTKKYKGFRQHLIGKTAFKDLSAIKEEIEMIDADILEELTNINFSDISKNEFVELMNMEGKSIILRQRDFVTGTDRKIVSAFMKVSKNPVEAEGGIKPANHGQIMASNLLRDSRVNIVTIDGSQGTGKTLIAIAQALRDVNYNQFDKLYLAKDLTPLDKYQYQGFTKGTTEEKILSQLGNYTSNIEMIYNQEIKHSDLNNGMDKLLDLISKGKVEVLDISSIKGSSFDNKIIIIDEAQTLNNKAMHQIVTRVKDNCKLIIIGDLKQGAMVELKKGDVGMETITDDFKKFNRMGHITLTETMRGEVQKQVFDALEKKSDQYE